jgi:hypothetical protein
MRWDGNQDAAGPGQLVFELAAELPPSLIEDGLVKARLSRHVLARLFNAACR